MDMNSQSPPLFASGAIANQNDKSLADALRQSILNLCEEHVLYHKQLRVMGVLCLAVDSMDADIVVKLNDSLIKTAPINNGTFEGMESEKSSIMSDFSVENGLQGSGHASRRKRKHLRPRRAPIHVADGGVATVNGDENTSQAADNINYNSEALACPIILPGEEEDFSIGAIAAASSQRSYVESREEGEISPTPSQNFGEDTVDGAIVLSDDNQTGCDASDYQNFRNFTLGTVVNASSYNNTFYIPSTNISELIAKGTTLQITAGGIHEVPSQVKFVTINNPQKSSPLAVRHTVNYSLDSNRKTHVQEKEEDTAAKVAKVVAAVQAAAAREREAKLAAAAICGVNSSEGTTRSTHRAIRKRKVCVSPDVGTFSEFTDSLFADPSSTASSLAGSDSTSIASLTPNKMFTCTFCGKHFNRKFCLERHERLHTGTKPYECLFCNERYIRLEDKKRHMRMVHPDKTDGSAASEVDEWSPSPTEVDVLAKASLEQDPPLSSAAPLIMNSDV